MFYHQKQEFFYRDVPSSISCEVAATPLPPDTVDTATIIATEFNLTEENRLSLSVEWQTPATYGTVMNFDYRIAITPVPSNINDIPSELRVISERSTNVSSSPTYIVHEPRCIKGLIVLLFSGVGMCQILGGGQVFFFNNFSCPF